MRLSFSRLNLLQAISSNAYIVVIHLRCCSLHHQGSGCGQRQQLLWFGWETLSLVVSLGTLTFNSRLRLEMAGQTTMNGHS